jgi:hypothetical protein
MKPRRFSQRLISHLRPKQRVGGDVLPRSLWRSPRLSKASSLKGLGFRLVLRLAAGRGSRPAEVRVLDKGIKAPASRAGKEAIDVQTCGGPCPRRATRNDESSLIKSSLIKSSLMYTLEVHTCRGPCPRRATRTWRATSPCTGTASSRLPHGGGHRDLLMGKAEDLCISLI